MVGIYFGRIFVDNELVYDERLAIESLLDMLLEVFGGPAALGEEFAAIRALEH